jgi:ABC-2 type transport system permease protein
MKIHRIKAIIIRYYYNFLHNLDRIFDSFYWPVMDILLWGLTFRYVVSSGSIGSDIVLMMLSGLVFWQVVWRAQYEIAVNFLEELWSQNLVNLFSTPIKLTEWLTAVIILGLGSMVVTVGLSMTVAWILYQANILSYGWKLIPFFASLLLMGWWVGFMVTGLLVLFGRGIQTFAWAGVYILAPFSAIYYPVSYLPLWAQKVTIFVPSSYVFEGMRQVLNTGFFSWEKWIISITLNIIYLALSLFFFKACFYKSLDKGLSRLEY